MDLRTLMQLKLMRLRNSSNRTVREGVRGRDGGRERGRERGREGEREGGREEGEGGSGVLIHVGTVSILSGSTPIFSHADFQDTSNYDITMMSSLFLVPFARCHVLTDVHNVVHVLTVPSTTCHIVLHCSLQWLHNAMSCVPVCTCSICSVYHATHCACE